MKIYLLIFLMFSLKSYIVEMEAYSNKKTCISELFKGGQPISFILKVTKIPENRYSIYITIETSTRVMLAHKKHDIETNVTNLTFNNESDDDLFICVDNFESYEILVALHFKVEHELGLIDSAPTNFEFDELNLKLADVKERIDSSYNYFQQNEAFTQKLVEAGQGFEFFMVLVTLITLGSFLTLGFLQIFFIRKDILTKKTW